MMPLKNKSLKNVPTTVDQPSDQPTIVKEEPTTSSSSLLYRLCTYCNFQTMVKVDLIDSFIGNAIMALLVLAYRTYFATVHKTTVTRSALCVVAFTHFISPLMYVAICRT